MPVEKLQINKTFFNKLDSVYKKKKGIKTQSFGSSPVSIITEKLKPKSVVIPDNTLLPSENVKKKKKKNKKKQKKKNKITITKI